MMTLQDRLNLVFPEPRVRGLMAAITKECGVRAPSVNPVWLAEGIGEMKITGSLARVAAGLDAGIKFAPAPIELEGNPDYPAVRRVSVNAQAH